MEEFIAAALDQRKVLNAKNINTIFGEGPIFNHWNERKLGSVHRLDQRMWSGLHLAAFVRCGVRQQVDALQGMWMPRSPACVLGPPVRPTCGHAGPATQPPDAILHGFRL